MSLAVTQETERYRVNTVALNIRETPSLSAPILGHATKDQIIETIGVSPDGYWVKHRINSVEGWSTKKYLVKLDERYQADEFPWLEVAEQEFGVVEFPGDEHNPRILEYFASVRNIGMRWKMRDETPWCSAFVNWCVEKAGFEGTKSALSTSWLSWGRETQQPVKGCLAIFSREGGGGHVGFYVDEVQAGEETFIRILGGNQDDPETEIGSVNLKYYPKSRLLGYRVP